MRDYANMPKIDWHEDKATLAKIKEQINLQEPIIIQMPVGFNFSVDASACGCEKKPDRLFGCQVQFAFAALAEANNLPALNELGKLAHDKGQVVDIVAEMNTLVVYD